VISAIGWFIGGILVGVVLFVPGVGIYAFCDTGNNDYGIIVNASLRVAHPREEEPVTR